MDLRNRTLVLVVCCGTIPIVYVIASVLQLNGWVSALFREERYWQYQIIFFSLLLGSFIATLLFSKQEIISMIKACLLGIGLGYAAGFIAIIGVTFMMPDGVSRLSSVFAPQRVFQAEFWMMFLGGPLFSMSWLVGGLYGLLVVIIGLKWHG